MFHKILWVNKMLRNLEGEGAEGRNYFLHKSPIIMEYNINTITSLIQKWKLRDYIDLYDSWRMNLTLVSKLTDRKGYFAFFVFLYTRMHYAL